MSCPPTPPQPQTKRQHPLPRATARPPTDRQTPPTSQTSLSKPIPTQVRLTEHTACFQGNCEIADGVGRSGAQLNDDKADDQDADPPRNRRLPGFTLRDAQPVVGAAGPHPVIAAAIPSNHTVSWKTLIVPIMPMSAAIGRPMALTSPWMT